MTNKIYLHATEAERVSLEQYAKAHRLTWNYSTLKDGTHLVAVLAEGVEADSYIVANYHTFPDMLDPAARLASEHVALLPEGCGVTTADSTYSAMRKVSAHCGWWGLHPLFSHTKGR